jgi:hypothetical protein
MKRRLKDICKVSRIRMNKLTSLMKLSKKAKGVSKEKINLKVKRNKSK